MNQCHFLKNTFLRTLWWLFCLFVFLLILKLIQLDFLKTSEVNELQHYQGEDSLFKLIDLYLIHIFCILIQKAWR